MLNLVILHYPCVDYGIPCDVISQYQIVKRAASIFAKNNINAAYFYDYLSYDDSIVYRDETVNYATSVDEIMLRYNIDILKCLNNIYDDVIRNKTKYCFIAFEPFAIKIFTSPIFNAIFKDVRSNHIKTIIYQYDFQWFYTQNIGPPENKNLANAARIIDDVKYNRNVIIENEMLDNCDLIISPTVSMLFELKSKYAEKCENIPFSYNNSNKQLFMLQNFEQFHSRIPRIIVSGATSVYTFRKILHVIKSGIVKNIKLYRNFISSFDNHAQFADIIDILPYVKLNRTKTNQCDGNGLTYVKSLSKYMGSFVCFGDYPLNFMLCKITESLLAGCTTFIEPNPYLKSEMGLEPFVHYIPILFDVEKRMVLDVNYYKQYLGTDIGIKIASQGFEYARERFSDYKVAQDLCDILYRRKIVS